MKICADCGHENEDDATTCAECFLELPVTKTAEAARPDPAELTDPEKDLVVVASFGDTVEAGLLKDRLEQAGIEACIPEELDPSPFGNFPPLAHVTVRVAKKDLEKAREVLAAA
jgi:hypothetical protein